MKNLQPDELGEIPVFSALTGEERSEICATQMIAKYSQGQPFLLENDWGNNLFLMLSGVAKVRTFTEEGEELDLASAPLAQLRGKKSPHGKDEEVAVVREYPEAILVLS